DHKANSRLTTALQRYSMYSTRTRYDGYLVASLINRECIEISFARLEPPAVTRQRLSTVGNFKGFGKSMGGRRRRGWEMGGGGSGGCWLRSTSARLNINSVLSGYISNAATTCTRDRKSLGFNPIVKMGACESVAVAQKANVKETPINVVNERENHLA
ncbi:hypothetical protein X777_09974, partial [Ooceraea biroi]